MRLYKALHLWRPKRKPNVMHAPKLNARPIGPEREIGDGRIQNQRPTVVKKRSAIARFFKTISKQFAYSGNQAPATAASGRKPNPIPAQSAPRAYEPKAATHVKHSMGQKSNLRPIERQREIGSGAVKKRSPIARFLRPSANNLHSAEIKHQQRLPRDLNRTRLQHSPHHEPTNRRRRRMSNIRWDKNRI